MKCRILFSGKNKKNVSICLLLKILSRVLRVNTYIKALITTAADDVLIILYLLLFSEDKIWHFV